MRGFEDICGYFSPHHDCFAPPSTGTKSEKEREKNKERLSE